MSLQVLLITFNVSSSWLSSLAFLPPSTQGATAVKDRHAMFKVALLTYFTLDLLLIMHRYKSKALAV